MILNRGSKGICESGPSVALVFLCDLRQVTASLNGWRIGDLAEVLKTLGGEGFTGKRS